MVNEQIGTGAWTDGKELGRVSVSAMDIKIGYG
jgi:hypothetical protein